MFEKLVQMKRSKENEEFREFVLILMEGYERLCSKECAKQHGLSDEEIEQNEGGW